MSSVSANDDDRPLEDRIFERLTAWQKKYPDGSGPRDTNLEGDIYKFLYRELKGIACVLPGLGWKANNPNIDASCRFTSALNRAFEKILERYPEKLMQTKSRKQLTGYVSRTMSNLMLNHYKRKGTFRRLMGKLGMTEEEDGQVRDILSHLAEEKGAYFEERTGIPFAKGLEVIREWDESDDRQVNDRATVLRLRYIDGLSYDDIAADMGIRRADVEKLLEQAKYHLRKLKA